MNINQGVHRILFIITQGNLGGAQIHIRDLCTYLYNHNYDVHVAVGVDGSLNEYLERYGVSVHRVPSLGREISLLADIKAYRELYCLVKRLKPDIVTTHSSKAGILGRLVCWQQNIPNVFTAHGWAFTDGVSNIKRRLYILIERMAAKWADLIICVSDYDRKLALKHQVGTETTLRIVHNGMPLIKESNLAQPDMGDVVRIIMVARFSEPKDQGQLLDAIYKLNCKDKCVIQLVGDGDKLVAVKRQAQKMKLTNVCFLGDRTDIEELLSQANIFVLTSNWEGFPLTILEAMRAGLPVVASDVGGVKEAVVHGETGFLVPRGDVQSLAACLENLINNPKLRADMGKNAHKRYEKNFTFEKMLNETIAIYDEVLQARIPENK